MKHFNDPGDEQEKTEEVATPPVDDTDGAAAEIPATEEPADGAMAE